MSHPDVGLSLAELDTPALCLDLDVLEANIRRMAELCRKHGVAWRPHCKAKKTAAICQQEIAAGAIGVTCAKLSEAEVMADGGIRDLLIANQLVGPPKVRRLVELARRADPILTIDHLDQALPANAAAHAAGVRVRTLIEVDIGLKRAGVAPGAATVELARRVADLPGLEFAGVMGYEGHLLTVPDPVEKDRRIREAIAELVATRDALHAVGLPCGIVSAAGTGSFRTTITCSGVTELQAGGLIFMDNHYRQNCGVTEFGQSMTVLCTIVSRPAPGRAVIDAGRKAHNIEVARPSVLGREDIRITRLSAEHGELELDPTAQDLRIGDKLQLVPGYSDLTSVLYNEFHGIRGGRVETVWPLTARGRLR